LANLIRSGLRGRGANLLKALITLALLGVLAATVDLRRVGQALLGVCWQELVGALLLYQAGMLVRAYRWQALLEGLGEHMSLSRVLGLYYVGAFFSNFLPSGFGGDVVRTLEVSRDGTGGARALSTVLMDRFMGLAVLLAMALCALPFSWHLVPHSAAIAVIVLAACTGLVLTVVVNQRLAAYLAQRSRWVKKAFERQALADFCTSFQRYGQMALLRAAGASLVFNLMLISTQMLLGAAVGVRIAAGHYFIFVPIISSLLVLPISLSGLGVREGGYVLLFGQVGVSAGQATAMSLLFYGLNLATGLVGAGLYVGQVLRRERKTA